MIRWIDVATLTAPGDARTARAAHPASLEPLAAGTRLGRYVILERLGVGGMSQVYRADDPGLRRQVAIKLLHPERALGAAARERFAREGQAMARLTHPNVATVFDTGEDGDRCYLALELLDGGTLADWLAAGRSEREIHDVMRSAARGLAAAHAHGIVHRDFKPENVLLTREGTPRVCDFGLAASVEAPVEESLDSPVRGSLGMDGGERLTVAGAVMGTPAYMSPEQREGKPADERSDQYSLCLVWLEALGRDRGCAAGDAGAARGTSTVVATLLRGLDADPAKRWRSIEALLAEIDGARHRRRRRLAAAGVVPVLAIAATAWTVYPGRGTPGHPERGAAGHPERGAAGHPERGAARRVERRVEGRVDGRAEERVEGRADEPAIVLRRHKPGEGTWRMILAGDGETVVRDSSERDSLWIEHVDSSVAAPLRDDGETHASSSLPLPAGHKVSRRMDAIPAVSADAGVVLVRMEDTSLWRTGRGMSAPVLMRGAAAGPVCLHPSGTRAVTGAIRAPIEIRATDDGRLLSTGPAADLCTWLGDRLVLGTRGRATTTLRILEPDGRVRELIELPGDLGALTVDRRGRIVVAHHVREGDDVGTGTLTALSADGPPAPEVLRRSPGIGYQFLSATARGLFIAEVPVTSAHLLIGAYGGDTLALRSLETGTANDSAPVWLDGERIAYSQGGARIVSQRVSGRPETTAIAARGQPMALAGGDLLVLERDSEGERDLRPRCRIASVTLASGERRVVDERPCTEVASVRCHDRGPCLLGLAEGDHVRFVAVDGSRSAGAGSAGPRSAGAGSAGPRHVIRPLAGTPTATVSPDGRWLIESEGRLASFDPATGVEQPFDVPGWPIDHVSWHPDGSHLLATSRDDAGFTLLRVALDGSARVLARSPQTLYVAPAVSPDGRWLAVQGSERLPVYVLVTD